MINVILPTRGRAKTSLPLFLKSLESTSQGPIAIIAVIDPEDTDTINLLDHTKKNEPFLVCTVNQPEGPPHLANLMNTGWNAFKTGSWLDKDSRSMYAWLYCGDDMEFKTKGWDTIAMQHIKDGYMAVGGQDGYMANENCPTWMVLSDNLLAAAGTFVCPLYACEGTDVAWADVLNPLDLLMFDHDLLIEHHHATRGSNKPDETYNLLQASKQFNDPGHWTWVKDTQQKIVEYYNGTKT